MLTDSHCHLDRLSDQPLEQLLDAARLRQVERFLCVAIDSSNTPEVVAIAGRHADVYATAGVHPMEVAKSPVARDWLVHWGTRPGVVALGETGLDYHYTAETAREQQESFVLHLQVASELGRPVVVHSRDARADTLELLRSHASREHAGVLHCFTEDWAMARAALDLNFYISFSGIVTFPRAEDLREVVKRVPLDRLLVETDAPYLAPVPYRGKTNQPAYVREVAQCCAELKGVPLQELALATSANFERLFPLAARVTP